MNINSKILIGIGILVVLLVGLYYFIQKQYQPVMSPSVNQSSTPSQAVTAPNTVSIQNFAFNPGTLTVKVGDTVTWINNDSVTHRIKANAFNSADLSQGDKFTFTFTTAGSFDYTCGIHPYMSGKIVVQ